MKIKRVFHPWHKCEEFDAGMWRKVSGDTCKDYVKKAADLMRNPREFKKAMAEAVKRWPISAEHNLTAIECNRRAWLGHAGCLVGVGSPEESTRAGWHCLTEEEQYEADRVAQEVIDAWEERYETMGQLFLFPDIRPKPKGRVSTNA